VCVLAVAALSMSCAERRDPGAGSGAVQVTRLESGSIPALRDSFNAASGQERILLLLSPT